MTVKGVILTIAGHAACRLEAASLCTRGSGVVQCAVLTIVLSGDPIYQFQKVQKERAAISSIITNSIAILESLQGGGEVGMHWMKIA